jgi:Glyoxalase-like domain
LAQWPCAGYGSGMEPGRLQITFDCLDPARAGRFWAAALAYPAPDVEGWHNFLRSQGRPEEDLNATFAIEDPAGVRPRMFFQRVPEPKSVKNRVHLDLAAPAADGSDRAEEIDAFADRLTELGALRLRAVKEDGYFVVMADPEGNEFCVD